MSTSLAPTENALFDKLSVFVAFIVPTGTEVVQGLGNRVPSPAGPYVAMTAVVTQRLATNISGYTDPFPLPDPGSRTIEQKTQLDVQFDFYGPDSGSWAAMAEALWRDELGCELLAPVCQPLYADTAAQVPTVTGEEQYQARWMLRASLQYNGVLTLPQQFTAAAHVTLIEVDERYPPS